MMAIAEDFNLKATVKNAIREALEEQGYVNILIAGVTGVGKSTLINAIFQGNFATTGQGLPVTPNTREIKKDGIPLSVFDTRGLEMADFDATINEVKILVSERAKNPDPRKHIHVAWICILENSRRVQPAEQDLCKMLASYIPVVAVITKIRSNKSDQGFSDKVKELLPLARNVIRTRALPEEDDDGKIKPALGLEELVDLTMQLVPEGMQRAFAIAQKVNFNQKMHSRLIAALNTEGVVEAPKEILILLKRFKKAYESKNSIELSESISSDFVGDIYGRTKSEFIAFMEKMFQGFPYGVSPHLKIEVINISSWTDSDFSCVVKMEANLKFLGLPTSFNWDSGKLFCKTIPEGRESYWRIIELRKFKG